MTLFRAAILALAVFAAGCAGVTPASRSTACQRLSSATPSATSALLTFRRSDSATITVRLAWEQNPDPIYSPRGPMRAISIGEAGRSVSVPLHTIRTDKELRTIEDLWPEYVELSSARPGDYDLLLSRGVPAGLGATLVEVRSYAFHSALPVTGAHLYPL